MDRDHFPNRLQPPLWQRGSEKLADLPGTGVNNQGIAVQRQRLKQPGLATAMTL